jgi:SAM-dependent methyltransferase
MNWEEEASKGSKKWESRRDLSMTSEELKMIPGEFLNWINSGTSFLDAGCGKGELLDDLNNLTNTKISGCDILNEGDYIWKGFFNRIPYLDNQFDRVLCLASIGTYAPNRIELIKDIYQLSRITMLNGEVIMFLNPLTVLNLFGGSMFNPMAHYHASLEFKKTVENPLDAAFFNIEDFGKNYNFDVQLLNILQDYGFEVIDKWVAGKDWRESWDKKRINFKPQNLAVKLRKRNNIDPNIHIKYLAKSAFTEFGEKSRQFIFSLLIR